MLYYWSCILHAVTETVAQTLLSLFLSTLKLQPSSLNQFFTPAIRPVLESVTFASSNSSFVPNAHILFFSSKAKVISV